MEIRRWTVVMVASVVALSIGVSRAESQEERNKALVRKVMEEIPVDDWDAQAARHSPDFVWHGPDGVTTMTRDELGEEILKIHAAFPDFKRKIVDMVAEGDKVAVRMVFRGTHRGEYAGIPATGKKITIHDMVLLRIADGKTVEGWEQCDGLSFMEQLTGPTKGAKAMKPVAVQKMLRRLSGHWSWTGKQEDIDSQASPYGQAGRFAGHGDGRLIMDGQFILDKWQEKSPEGNMLYGMSLISYDPIEKCFVGRDYMSDGSTCVNEFTLEKRVRKDRITITSKTGEIILARVAGEYSDDWKRFESTWEGSTDNGKTWRKWATLVSERSDDVAGDPDAAKPTSRDDFVEFCRLYEGRWMGEITWATDWPGYGKKGDTVTIYRQHTISQDGHALAGTAFCGEGSATRIFYYDTGTQLIRCTDVSSGGSTSQGVTRKDGKQWTADIDGIEPDGTKVVLTITATFSDNGKTVTERGSGTRGNEKVEFVDVWHRVSK